MKRLILSMLTLPLVLLASTGLASAHVLKEDHGISAVLHIPPDDNPEAGQLTELDFSFGDDAQTFSLQDCHCQVIVKSGGKVVQQVTPKPAVPDAPLDAIAMVTFPQVGVYDVIVNGSATHGAFQAFNLDFRIRVAISAGGVNTAGQGSEILIIGVGSLAILTLFAYNNIQAGGRYASSLPKRAKMKGKS